MAAKKKNEKSMPPVAAWKREQGWEKLAEGEEAILEAYCKDYMDYISYAKTERMAHDRALELAKKAGYKDMDAVVKRGGRLKPGDKVYRSCYGKTLFLAQIGKESLENGLNLVGSHIDSPRLDLKPYPLYEDDKMVLLDTHYYGGIKKYQWTTIHLALHGVVYRRDGSKVELHIGEDPSDPVFMITDLLPHLSGGQNGKPLASAFQGDDMNVLVASRPVPKGEEDKDFGEKTKLRVLRMLKDRYGIEEEDFASAEIEIVPAGPARELGFDRSMISGYGQDDRVCAFGAVRAMLDDKVKVPARTRAAVICDKEEIGSVGQTGMESTFMENTVAELIELTEPGSSNLKTRRCLERSMMISGDVCAVHDPLYKDVSSPHNMAQCNCGIGVCKYTGGGGKGHASDASAEFMSKVRGCFNDNGVVWQMTELGKVDVGGGGTIAYFLAHYGMSVVDCGVALFNMHAPLEVAGKLDIYMAYKAYKAFLGMA